MNTSLDFSPSPLSQNPLLSNSSPVPRGGCMGSAQVAAASLVPAVLLRGADGHSESALLMSITCCLTPGEEPIIHPWPTAFSCRIANEQRCHAAPMFASVGKKWKDHQSNNLVRASRWKGRISWMEALEGCWTSHFHT